MTDIGRDIELFERAIDLPAAERDAFLEAECSNDPERLARVRPLLEAHDRAGETMAPNPLAAHRSIPRAIGRYTILERIGQGGMGVVFSARQHEPIDRTVAIKLISLAHDSQEILSRFEAERRTLALMDHANIAKILDAGVYEDRPYFVMELIHGSSITEYCDARKLGIEDRIRLFRQVCLGVQHAHQKGIIHRDIKPSNVLVTEQDGVGIPKIIDFGVSKALEGGHGAGTHTEVGRIIGTPDYMSPEQAQGDTTDIDTRSDVYSLGALLYELLTGYTVFGLAKKSAKIDEIRSAVLDQTPGKPSTRFRETTPEADRLADRRRSSPEELRRRLSTDLDWIVLKALEKPQSRRYDSVGAFAADLQRYLDGEPVVAAPPTRIYRTRKFIRRHRGPVAAASLLLLSLCLGLAAFAVQSSITRKQRDRAIRAEREVAQRLDEVEQITDFQSDMLMRLDTFKSGLGITTEVLDKHREALLETGLTEEQRQEAQALFESEWRRLNTTDLAVETVDSLILRPALESLAGKFKDQPAIEARLRFSLGDQYFAIGKFDYGMDLMREATTVLEREYTPDHPILLSAKSSLAFYLSSTTHLDEAVPMIESVLAAVEASTTVEPELKFTIESRAAEIFWAAGQFDPALKWGRAGWEGFKALLGEDHPDTLRAQQTLAGAMRESGDLAGARALEDDVLARRRRVLGPDDAETIRSISSSGNQAWTERRVEDAVALFKEAYEGRARVHGAAHPITQQSAANYAQALAQAGDTQRGNAILRESLEAMRQSMGRDASPVLTVASNLSVQLTNARQYEEAEELALDTLARRRRVQGDGHPDTLISFNVASYVYRRQGNNEKAAPYLQTALDVATTTLGPDHPDRLIYLFNVGSIAESLGQIDKAIELISETATRGVKSMGLRHPTTRRAIGKATELMFAQQRYPDVLDLALPMLEQARQTGASDAGDLAALLGLLNAAGRAHSHLGRWADAERNLEEAYTLLRDAPDATPAKLDFCIKALIEHFNRRDAASPGEGFAQRASEWEARLSPPPEPKPE